MSAACVVSVEIPADEFALYEALSSLPDVEFEVERIVQSGEDAAMPLMWIRNADHDSVESTFRNDPSVQDLTLLSTFENEQLYRMEWISEVDVVLQMLTNSKATIMDAYGYNGQWSLRVLYPDRDLLTKTTDFAENQGFTFEVTAIRPMKGKPVGRFGLTQPQFDALVTGFTEGFYNIPRDIDTKDLADELNISHQALSERLRRATGALIEDTLLVGAAQTRGDDS